jgi:hypothetical protein
VYRFLARRLLGTPVRDLQCGLKACDPVKMAAALRASRHDGWLFDTELIVLAELAGVPVVEVAVEWNEAPGSQVRVPRVARAMFTALLALRRELRSGELRRRLARTTK